MILLGEASLHHVLTVCRAFSSRVESSGQGHGLLFLRCTKTQSVKFGVANGSGGLLKYYDRAAA